MAAARLAPRPAPHDLRRCLPLVSLRAFRCQPPPLPHCAGRRRASAAAAAAVAADGRGDASAARLAALFAGGPVLCLERAVASRQGCDEPLWRSGAFSAEVYPDLPVATSWTELARRLLGGPPPGLPAAAQDPSGGPPATAHGRWLVRTVAAQVRSRDALRARALACAGVDAEGAPVLGGRPADALLFVSGGHPARALPFASSWLPGSLHLLREAAALRAAGTLPRALSLWAVENPLLGHVDRLASKADAGAEVVLTQPPLLPGRCERWAEAAAARGLGDRVKIVIGVPMASSVANLDFWLRLCGARHLPEAAAALASFPGQGGGGTKEQARLAVRDWNANLIRRALQLPGVAGLHVMPLTAAARDMTLELVQDGTLPVPGALAR